MNTRLIALLLALPAAVLHSQERQMKPEETEDWSREPEVVTPGEHGGAPSDAIVLFRGPEDLGKWEGRDGQPAAWDATEILTVTPGTGPIRTKQHFGDVQLHIEWRTPEKVRGKGQGRGNSGIFLMGRYEVQVLDSYRNLTYYNGQAGSIYKEHIPLVNACRPPGEWQSYDIVFSAPVFDRDSSLLRPAYITVIHNGVLIQNHVEIRGTTEYVGPHSYSYHEQRQPLELQDHGNPVSFRNIWIRQL